VASKLGYKWYFVEYKKNLYLEIVKKDIFYEYLDFDFNFVSLPHTQDFFAVYYLKKNYLIPENSVFIPGHSGDFFAGTHIYNVNYNSNKMHIANEIFNHHYILSDYCSYKHELINRIFFQLKDGLPWTVMENWDLENRQAKFIVNSLRVYEFFGYENRIPLWNPKLANYFKKIDIKYKNRNNSYKLKNNLYDSIAMKIFNKYNVDIKKKVSNNNILLKIIKKTLKYIILKTRILKLLYYKYINRAKIDVNNYKDLCDVLEIDYNININKSLIKFIKRKLLSST